MAEKKKPFLMGSTLMINISGGDTYKQLKNIKALQLPNQSFTTATLDFIDAGTGISERIKTGAREGGQLTFTVTDLLTENPGLADLLTAYEDTGYTDIADQPKFKITLPSGTTYEMNGVITQCNPAAFAKDGTFDYECSVEVNNTMTKTVSA